MGAQWEHGKSALGGSVHGGMRNEWAGQWAAQARAAGGGLLGNLLADLADDVRRVSRAVQLRLPVEAAAAALRVPPAALPQTLERLATAGLLTYRLTGADAEPVHAAITLHTPTVAAGG
ncbi:hypothetical protein OG625_22870 [Streptomyces sp. NBC_01351]|uniref:hypothetical protein n=1 Tax=Streptomyces sp. NBC_01351 TaxID=2903833 RepID=UPI002E3608AD|nr:hypothetical protein [Streptomyces sp. NBC_01351]